MCGIVHHMSGLPATGTDGFSFCCRRDVCRKNSFPGCYDISSAGHIPAGEEYIPSAIRELKEELNVTVQESDLIYCGQVHKDVDSEFHRQPFHDHQISNVYLLWLDREAEEFELQTEEIESVRWMDYAQVRGMVGFGYTSKLYHHGGT